MTNAISPWSAEPLPMPPLPWVDEPSAGTGSEGDRRAMRRQTARLLVVEDEEVVRLLVVWMLAAEGYEVCEARHGREALDILAQRGGAIDLVVSDVVMSVMGGPEFARALATRYPGLPVLWVSGYPSSPGSPVDAIGRQHPFLQKPVAAELLVQTVARLLFQRGRDPHRPHSPTDPT